MTTGCFLTFRFFSSTRFSNVFRKVSQKYNIQHTATIMTSANGEASTKRIRCENMGPTIGTHSGTFHCDEVLACFMLRQLPEYENAKIFRSRNSSELREKCDIILDVGDEFSHENKRYDHHQRNFKETLSSLRPELGDDFKIKLSSAGLIYTFYGERVLDSILQRHAKVTLSPDNLKLTYVQIYRNFISEIDAIDNGIPLLQSGEEPVYKISTHVSARIGKLNPTWEEDNVDVQERFELAMTVIGEEFVRNVVAIGGSWIRAREYVRDALKKATSVYKSGEILVLEPFCPWKAHLADLEKQYNVEGIPKLIMFSEGETWRVTGVPVSPSSFTGRKFLPESWRGLRDNKLSEAAGIPNLIFVHHSGFIGGASSKESALKMAIKSVEWNDEI